jgi:anti-repressor protein
VVLTCPSLVRKPADFRTWFVGQQVAKPLGYSNPGDAIRTLCKHSKIFNHNELLSLGFTDAPFRGLLMIPEGDVMRLIARSNLPAA